MDMKVLLNVFGIFQFILLLLSGAATIYFAFFSFTGLFYKDDKKLKTTKYRKFAVLIPGYKEDDVIIDVASDALRQKYPQAFFDVIIIADSFQKSTLQKLYEMPLKVIEVSFDKSTKAKALNEAILRLDSSYDIALVLDSDNVMEEHFLEKMNVAFEREYLAIQAHRTAKNMNTNLAMLDAVSEEINNHIFRKGHRALGLSSAIIGSGVAFEYQFFSELMPHIKAIGGFDKEIELRMLKQSQTIGYLNDALVFDEKVQDSNAFTTQRRRWLSAQFHYLSNDFASSLKALIMKFNVDYFLKIIQFAQPPRVLLLAFLVIENLFFILLNSILNVSMLFSFIWLTFLIICVIAFLLAIPSKFYNAKTFKALIDLPKGMVLMFISLLKIRGANRQFLHTPHGSLNQQKD